MAEALDPKEADAVLVLEGVKVPVVVTVGVSVGGAEKVEDGEPDAVLEAVWLAVTVGVMVTVGLHE